MSGSESDGSSCPCSQSTAMVHWNETHNHYSLVQWCFDLSGKVHPASWGIHESTKRVEQWTTRDFQLQEKLGSGYFGTVYRADYLRHDNDDDTLRKCDSVALKVFSKSKLMARQRTGRPSVQLIRRECNIQSHLDHPHIIKLLGYYEDPKRLHLVLEFAEGGDALQYMCNVVPKRRLRVARQILWQVAQALAYLECVRVAHRDIKPENIMIARSRSGKVHAQLGDFGWSVWYKIGVLRHTTLCGTAEYIPPELLTYPVRYRAEFVDVWMLGVLAVELMQGMSPFRPYEDPQDSVIFSMIRGFRHAKHIALLPLPLYQDLVHRLLCKEPSVRMSATDALRHGFFTHMEESPHTNLVTVAQRRQLFQQTC